MYIYIHIYIYICVCVCVCSSSSSSSLSYTQPHLSHGSAVTRKWRVDFRPVVGVLANHVALLRRAHLR